MSDSSFRGLGLAEPILHALEARGYTTPTPIQAQAIPPLLVGKDLLGIAQTGTGKTAAFALPILHLLDEYRAPREARTPRVLVLTPTRELATQIGDSFASYSGKLRLKHTVVFGGVGQGRQVRALRDGVDILVATPGRLIDLMDQGHVYLDEIEWFVLDEADRMLDMGFLPDVKKVLKELPGDRQSLLFSATMPDDIAALAARFLRDPVRVEVTPPSTTVEKIEQRLMLVEKDDKRALLAHVLQDPVYVRTLVFTRTKHGADRVAKHLTKAGVPSAAIHGNKSQGARERALQQFRDGKLPVLVATDIAARGIDVPGITHVVNFDLPNIPESYVHRIGRTARAGHEGIALSFCDQDEREFLRDIEKNIGRRIDLIEGHPFASEFPLERNDRGVVIRRGAGGGKAAARGNKPGGGRGRTGGTGARPQGKPRGAGRSGDGARHQGSRGEDSRGGGARGDGPRGAGRKPGAPKGKPSSGGPRRSRRRNGGGRPSGGR